MLKISFFPDFSGPPFLKLSPFPADNAWDNFYAIAILAIVNLCEIHYFKNKVAYRTYA